MHNQITYEAIPPEIKDLQQWVGWKYIHRENAPKPSKVPINPHTGEYAKSNDQSTWGTAIAAMQAVTRHNLDGIGVMFANGLAGIDIDSCVDSASGVVSEMALEIVDTVQSYTEYSPSGTGLHILFFGEIPAGERKNDTIGLEMYENFRFFTFTGRQFERSYPFNSNCSSALARIHYKYLRKDKPEIKQGQGTAAPVDLDDQDLLDKAFAGRNGEKFQDLWNGNWQKHHIGTGGQSSEDQALCNMLAFWTGRDMQRMDRLFRQSGLMRPKWDERRGEATYGERTLRSAVENCTEVYTSASRRGSLASPSFRPRTPNQDSAQHPSIALDTALKPLGFTWDDTGNAQRLRAYADGDYKYNPIDKVWMYWDGTRWAVDDIGEIKRCVDHMLFDLSHYVKSNPDVEGIQEFAKHIKKSRSSKSKEAMIKECRHLEGIPVRPSELDRPTNVFNTKNALVSLRTGNTMPHNREHLLSKVANVEYQADATCPIWNKFIDTITCGNGQLAQYLQVMAGYCMTASTQEQCVFFLFGKGSNGKSTFVDTLARMMGEYAANCQPETVMLKDRANNTARSDIARLKGVRLATAAEPSEGARLDEGTVKQMTGGTENKLTARFQYGSEFEFTPEFKIIMSTNHKPVIKGTDNGIWRRIRLIPFNAELTDQQKDRRLPDKLKAELPGILNWAIAGSMYWYQYGFPACDVVDVATHKYRGEMDLIQQFCNDCITPLTGHHVQSSVLYNTYKNWCFENGYRFPVSSSKFTGDFKERYTFKKMASYNAFSDISLTEYGTELRNK